MHVIVEKYRRTVLIGCSINCLDVLYGNIQSFFMFVNVINKNVE